MAEVHGKEGGRTGGERESGRKEWAEDRGGNNISCRKGGRTPLTQASRRGMFSGARGLPQLT